MTVRSLFPILSTRDLPRLAEFYGRALGATISYRFPAEDGGDAYVSLALGAAVLGLGADAAVPPRADDRVALWFYVTDVETAHRDAMAAGAQEERAPTRMPWGEVVSQLRDPDGNLVNLAAEPDDSAE